MSKHRRDGADESPPAVRCAIYTRKSTDEGLEQDFNSLDAQREAAEHFIRSQKTKGWVCLPDHYDDGGYSGGDTDRPALKRLLADVQVGLLDVIVVYKVDRLSRSLLDFARLIGTFDEHGVSLVSVTQQLNTTSSMGRLTLNILLSFAQFEREMISERTRDKMHAARKKGKWIGGRPMLGYDVDPRGGRLLVNEAEAVRVRAIFELYLQLQSLLEVVKELNRRGWHNKRWITKKGREAGGGKFQKTTLFKLVTNMVYIGKVSFQGKVYEGEHEAIVSEDVWHRVRQVLRRNHNTGGRYVRNKYGALLKGLIVCGSCDTAMIHSFTKKPKKRYRYYVCTTAQKRGWETCPTKSVPAGEIERFVVDRIRCIGEDPGVLAETLEGAKARNKETVERLEAEQEGLQRDVKRLNQEVRRLIDETAENGDGTSPATAKLAEAQDRIRATEQRATEIREELLELSRDRNNTLNRAAFKLGTLVGGGHLDRAEVEAALRGAAGSTGLDPKEIDATIRSGIEAGIQRPRHIDQKPLPGRPSARRDYILTPGLHVDGSGTGVEQSTALFADQVLSALPADSVYRKDFIPGEVLGPAGRRKWVEFSADRMRLVVDGHAKLGKWVKSRESKGQVLIYQPCAKDAAGLVIAHAQQAPAVRELELMVAYPVYGPGFTRIPPGWHDGLYYDEPPDLRGLEPETDCEVIHNVLHDLVVDFPFKTEADRQNFFGLMLTPIVAPALDGNRPMHLINSPLERTGKSKLVNEVLGGVLIGRDEIASMQITEREEEREKRIIAALIQGDTMLHLDNLPHWIDSQSLASLLTSHILGGRILGFSRTVKLRNNLTVVGTGNNVQASGEVAKRIVPVMIEPRSAHPERRTDFQHPNIRTYARERRRVVLECLLGLVENWLAAGRPAHPNRLGGFENWSEIIGGILKVNALTKWRTNEKGWRALADPRGAEMKAFVEAWYEEYEENEAASGDLVDLARRRGCFNYIFTRRTPQAIGAAFGKMLVRHVDQPVDKWFIRRSGSATHASYYLQPIQPEE